MRYDNDAGKVDHRHVNGREEPYRFVSTATLRREIRKYRGDDEEEDRSDGRRPIGRPGSFEQAWQPDVVGAV